MTQPTHTWKTFKSFVDDLAATGRSPFFRGQSQDTWGLVSTYHRLVNPGDPSVYWQTLELVRDYISTWTSRAWDLKDNLDLASFLGFLQHNGFPTPLLDWTRSPYAAAYFAFEEVNDPAPASDNIAIFAFDHAAWSRDWKPIYDVQSGIPHVSVLMSQSRGNQKQILQQGAYTFSTVHDQEKHIRDYEARYTAQHGQAQTYLTKTLISVHEKPVAMRDLGLMGITHMTLFPGVEGVCRHLKNALFPAPMLGLTPTQRTEAFLESLRSMREQKLPAILGVPAENQGSPSVPEKTENNRDA